MRFPPFLLLLVFIYSITSTSAQVGTWSAGEAKKDASPYCCIPTSVVVSCPSNTNICSATFKYPNSMNSKCYAQFKSTGSYTLNVYYTYGSTSAYYYSAQTPGGKMNMYLKLDMGWLRISSTNPDECDFIMTGKEINSGSGNNNNNGEFKLPETILGFQTGGVLFFIIFWGSIYWCVRKKQKDRDEITKSHNNALAQLPTHLVPNLKFNPVPPPQQMQLQQFNQHQNQPQPTYNAPAQFVPPPQNVQVHMNTSGNMSAPGQFVPPKINASVQENVGVGVKTGSGQLPVPNFQVHLHPGVKTSTGQLPAPNFQVHMNNGGSGK